MPRRRAHLLRTAAICGIAAYDGPLREIERPLRAGHMDFMFIDWRMRMEIEATTGAVRFLSGQALESEVPENT